MRESKQLSCDSVCLFQPLVINNPSIFLKCTYTSASVRFSDPLRQVQQKKTFSFSPICAKSASFGYSREYFVPEWAMQSSASRPKTETTAITGTWDAGYFRVFYFWFFFGKWLGKSGNRFKISRSLRKFPGKIVDIPPQR